jgi:hypothetical protein
MLERSGSTSIRDIAFVKKRCEEFGVAGFCGLAFVAIGPIKRDVGYADYRPLSEEREGYEGVEAVLGIDRRQDGEYTSCMSAIRRQHW